MKTLAVLPLPWNPSEINLKDIFMSNNLLAAERKQGCHRQTSFLVRLQLTKIKVTKWVQNTYPRSLHP